MNGSSSRCDSLEAVLVLWVRSLLAVDTSLKAVLVLGVPAISLEGVDAIQVSADVADSPLEAAGAGGGGLGQCRRD